MSDAPLRILDCGEALLDLGISHLCRVGHGLSLPRRVEVPWDFPCPCDLANVLSEEKKALREALDFWHRAEQIEPAQRQEFHLRESQPAGPQSLRWP